MIYKNENGKNVIQFGTGDIEVGNGRVISNDKKEMYPCLIFVQQEKETEIGVSVNPGHENDPAEQRSDAHTTFVFTDPRSIDVVIDHLYQAKERFKNGLKVMSVQGITDEISNDWNEVTHDYSPSVVGKASQ